MNSSGPQESIAIVGMAGRFPRAKNLEEFWQNLRAGRECISFFKDEPIQHLPIEHPPRADDPRYVRARGVLEKPEWFDAGFFGLNPKEAEMMDPQHRVFLECAWEALEDAGCNPDTFDGLIGVFAGASMNTYLLTNLMTNRDLIADFGMFSSLIMNDGDFVPTRVSYKFNLRGPSINVQTACSTSLVAVALAAQNLLGYRCDVALAGGVSITFPSTRGQFHLEGGILSKDGHCRTFDADASGTVLGDGAGIVVLKRLSDALADGDRICAVIKGSAINNDGAVKIGYTAPSIDGQAEVIAMAQAEAGFAPDSVSYVEAHGTGTPLGDPIEIAGLTKAFGLDGRKGQFCAVGSVKSNIGHLDIGAGVAGLIKTVLALQHREIPPSLHFTRPNPKIDLVNSPFFVNETLCPWRSTAADQPLRAGVSSFGIGGTNAHVALEESPVTEAGSASRPRQLLLLSAKTASALDAMAGNLAAFIESHPEANLPDVAYTLQVGRKEFGFRRAVVCASAAEAVSELRIPLSAPVSVAATPSVAFLFPGQGAQAVEMARGLYECEPEFRALVDQACEILKPLLALDLRDVLFAAPDKVEAAGRLLDQTHVTQPAMFVIEYAMAQLWMGWGIKPAAMLGHSLGEYVAATIAGVFSLDDALALVAERARLMQAQTPGAMLAVRANEQRVSELLDNTLALAAVNAPGLCVVSGPFDAVEAAERRLAASAIPFKRLSTSHAFHSPMMEPVLAPFGELVRKLKLDRPQIPWVSNVTGTWITAEQATSAEYWVSHLRHTVRFADGVGTLVRAGHRLLVEVGPGQTLAGLARQHPTVTAEAVTVVSSLSRHKSPRPADSREAGPTTGAADGGALLQALGEVWVAGATVNWRPDFYRRERRRIVALPTYPFERQRYWIEPGSGWSAGENGTTSSRVNALTNGSHSEVESRAASSAAAAPEGASTLAALKALFQNLSGIDLTRASADTSYYQLGFDSLFLTQASLAVSRRFGFEVTFRQLREDFETLGKLAARIDAQGDTSPGAAEAKSPIRVAEAGEEKRIPLTDAQREMWFASQLGTAVSSAYNEATTLRLRGALDAAALQHALNQLAARHEALRTTFSADGDFQRIVAAVELAPTIYELSGEALNRREACAAEIVTREGQRSFDLVAGPLFRVALVRIDVDTHLLALVVHHIICDGWSLGILTRELAELYAAETAHRPPTLADAPSFSDYADQVEKARGTPAFTAAETYWKKQFSDGAPVLELPTDRPRPKERDHGGGFLLTTLDAETTDAVKQLCARQNCTAFTALLSVFNVLLHRLTGQDDVVVGVPSAAQVMDGKESLVGHFANLLPIRSRLQDEQRFSDYLASIRQSMTDGLEHWRYPFSHLLRELNLPRAANRVPLAPVVFNTTRRRGTLAFAGIEAEVVSNPKRFVNFDLNFNFALTDDTISLGCYYSTELFDEATIARWFEHFKTLISAVAANPDESVSRLPLLTAAQRDQILVAWNQTTLDFDRTASIPQLFEAQVRMKPNAVALVAGRERLTYAELDQRANQLAEKLCAAGVGPDVPVGIFLERSPHLVVAMLGVLKAGGAYVPLDPNYPAQRVAFLIGDTHMPVVVTERSLVTRLLRIEALAMLIDEIAATVPSGTGERAHSSVNPLKPSNLAYIIYTSGSTGQPKGVCVPHQGVVALAAWAKKHYRAEELDGVVFSTSATFDVSVFESLVPLCLGGKIILAENILELSALPAASEARLISGVPSAVAELVRLRQVPSSVETVNVAGEPCPQSLVEALYGLRHVRRVVDVYGPTETTVYSTGSVREPGGSATIGRPLPNEQAYIFDRHLQPVPIGVRGELYLGGEKLARGYLNQPELTCEKFIEWAPTPGAARTRLYRTGDAARFRADGAIEFLGRLDHQVKIRGFRVELGEIESALSQHAAIREAVVVARPGADGNAVQLAAYVAAKTNGELTARELREHLRLRLPAHMVPSAFVLLESLPRTASGKVDRRALPAPAWGVERTEPTAPRTTTEELLADIWCEVLGIERPGVHDNFFELGGHSLLATQVMARIHDALTVDLPMREFFASPTVAELALVVDAALLAELNTTADTDNANVVEPVLETAKI